MTDEELRAKNNRFEMEKKYQQYMAERNPKKQSRFKKVAGEVIESSVKTLATKAMERIANNLLADAKEAKAKETPKEAPKEPKITGIFGRKLEELSDSELAAMSTRIDNIKKVESHLAAMDAKKAAELEDLRKRGAFYTWFDGGGI